jgi:hypothetical protein
MKENCGDNNEDAKCPDCGQDKFISDEFGSMDCNCTSLERALAILSRNV